MITSTAVVGLLMLLQTPLASTPDASAADAPAPDASPTDASPTDAPQETRPVERVAIDGVAAVVDRKVITISEVRAEARLALLEKAGFAAAAAPLDARFLRTVLDHLVVQELLMVEARRGAGAAVKEGAVEARVAGLRALFASPTDAATFFSRYGIDDELIRSRARRDLLNQALVSEAIGRAGPPSDDEVSRTAGPQADAAQKEAVRTELLRQRRDQAFKELVARLREDLDVRIVVRDPQ